MDAALHQSGSNPLSDDTHPEKSGLPGMAYNRTLPSYVQLLSIMSPQMI